MTRARPTTRSRRAVAAACTAKASPPPPPPDVLVTPVVQKDVPIVSEWIGTLDGSVNADIRPQVEGYLVRQLYKDGQFVRRGDRLFEIDPRQFRAALAQAQGTLGRAEAERVRAAKDVERFTPLAAQRAVSQQELDNAVAAERDATAAVAAARAAVDQAALNLGWTTHDVPDRRHRGDRDRPGRGPGEPADGHDHGVHRRSHPRDLQHLGARIPARRGAHQPSRLRHDRARPRARAGARGRERVPPCGPGRPRGPPGGREHGHDHDHGASFRIPRTSSGRDSTRGSARPRRSRRARSSSRSGRCRSCRGVIAWPWSGRTARPRSVPSRPGERVGDLWVIDKGLRPDENVIVVGLQFVQAGMAVNARPAPAPTPSPTSVASAAAVPAS